jgi:predicted MFS family arabinose efflux permease
MLLGTIVATLFWIIFAFVSHRYLPFLLLMMAVGFALVLISTIAGGLLVEAGQATGATGKLSSVRATVMCVASLIAGPAGGYLATKSFSAAALSSAILCGALFIATVVILRERRREGIDRGALRNTRDQLLLTVKSRPLLLAALFTFFIAFAPGFQTPLYFYQTDTLHFSPEFIGGRLQVLNNIFGVGGCALYAFMCRRFTLRFVTVTSIVLCGVSALCYLRYQSPVQAMVVESLYGFGSSLVWVMSFDVAAQATPGGCEALAYSLLMSAWNLSTKLSDVSGSWLLDHFHLQFPQLVWINSATTLLTLVAIPLLPQYLLNHRDGAPTTS